MSDALLQPKIRHPTCIIGMTTENFTELVDLASERLGGRSCTPTTSSSPRRRICLRPAPPSSSRASTRNAASGWTGGSRADAGRPASTGASSGWGSLGALADSSSTRVISGAITQKVAPSTLVPSAPTRTLNICSTKKTVDGDSSPNAFTRRFAEPHPRRLRRALHAPALQDLP